MHLGIDLWKDFDEFWKDNGSNLTPKSTKHPCDLRNRFLKNLWFATGKNNISMFGGSKLNAHIDERSIKKWSQDGKASWHRFLKNLGGSLRSNIDQNPSQEASKKLGKKEGQQDKEKVARRRFNPAVRRGSWVPGRSPPIRRASPLGSPGWSPCPLLASKVLYSTWKYLKVL